MAIGGSTNTTLHLPAIAKEIGISLTLETFAESATRIPHLMLLKPAGEHFPRDFYNAGGVPALMKMLEENNGIHSDCLTVSTKTIGDWKKARFLSDIEGWSVRLPEAQFLNNCHDPIQIKKLPTMSFYPSRPSLSSDVRWLK